MEGAFILVILGAVLVVIFLVFFFSRDAVIRRKLRKTPLVRLGEVTDDQEGRFVGKIGILAKMAAPLSQRPCVHYHVKVRQKRRSGKHSHCRTIIDEHMTMDFALDDGSGTAEVQTDHVDVAVDKDAHYRSGFLNDASEQLDTFLQSRGHESAGWLGFNKTLKYAEGILEEGETVAVLGRVVREKDPDDGESRLIIKPGESGVVLVSDYTDTTR
jgi:hypothetical protein